MNNSILWYDKPASDWLEGLPIGNGRLAAMVLGQHPRERLALNHEWLWTGKNRHRDVEEKSHHLTEVRRLLLEGNYTEGTELANIAFGGNGGASGKPNRIDAFQTAGDLWLEMNHRPIFDYRRELDLERAVVKTTFKTLNNKQYTRTCIAHPQENMIFMHVAVSGEKITANLSLNRIPDQDCELSFEAAGNLLKMHGKINNGITFCVQTRIFSLDGELTNRDNREILITGASEMIIAVNIGTSGNGNDPEEESGIREIAPEEWPDILRKHVADYSKHYMGMSLDLPVGEPAIPTCKRIELVKNGGNDDGLPLLFFNYARYLLFASSAVGELPANLQGKWCENLNPPWESDYHHNINLQMNYWLAEPAGMQTSCEALFRHIERFVPHAREVAKKFYACEGVLFPLQTDPWGRATPESCGWAVWNGAAPWLAQHFWWHYQFSQDREFLKNRAYPFIKEVAAFFEAFLIEDEDGVLQIVPSQSPENRFEECECRSVSICVSASMDIELVWDVFTHAIAAAEALGIDQDKRETWKQILHKLPPLQIGSKGQLLEWNHEFKEVDPGHRHISHLFGLFPGEQIDPETTPELFKAAARSLELRMENFGGHTGWSRAWTACCFARLGNGDEAFKHVEHLITDYASSTMLDLHPPRIFQIDGNLGGGATIIEMLLQSYREELHFLPALPGVWPEGRVTGVRARGGFTVDFSWAKSELTDAIIKSVTARTCTIVDVSEKFVVKTADGSMVEISRNDHRITFEVLPEIEYHLVRCC